jgi:hypothetical protein
MGYGIKMSFDMVWDTVSGTTTALGGILAAFGVAGEQALQGNFRGAADTILLGASDSVNTLKNIGTRITEDAKKNLKAMQLAQGMFNKDMAPAGMPGSSKQDKKKWVPPDKKETSGIADFIKSEQAALDAYVKYLHAFEERVASEVKAGAAKEMEINKQAYEHGLIDFQTYLDKKHTLNQTALQAELTAKEKELVDARAAEAKAMSNSPSSNFIKDANAAAAQTEKAIQAVTEAQSKLTIARMVDADESQRSAQTELEGWAKAAAAISAAEIEIAKMQGQDTTILEGNKAIQDSKSKILMLEKSIGNIKASELAITLAQIAAEKSRTKELEQQVELNLRKGILNGSITGVNGGYNAMGQWEYKDVGKWKQDNPYIADAALLSGGGNTSNSSSNTVSNTNTFNINGAQDPTATANEVARKMQQVARQETIYSPFVNLNSAFGSAW